MAGILASFPVEAIKVAEEVVMLVLKVHGCGKTFSSSHNVQGALPGALGHVAQSSCQRSRYGTSFHFVDEEAGMKEVGYRHCAQ